MFQALPPADVPAIVVTGAALPRPPGEAAFGVKTIPRERLTTSASGRLEDVLRDVAGFAQFRRSDARSAHPTAQGATLRGLGGNASSRALVLLDGVPQADPFGGWISFAALDPDRLGLVRVTRGGGGGVAGPGALAGTIELSSATPSEVAGVRARAAYGNRDAVDAFAGVGARLGAGFATVSASYAGGDGFTPVMRSVRGAADRPARYDQISLAARALVPVDDAAELQATMLAFQDERTRGLAFTDNRTRGADASVRLVARGRWGWEALGYVQARAFRSGFAGVDAARATAFPTLDQYNVPATAVGGRLEVRPPLGQGLTLRAGVDARRAAGTSKEFFSFVAGTPTRRREAGGRTLTAGTFAELAVEPSRSLTLTGAARVDRWRISGGKVFEQLLATGAALTDARFADRSGWEPTARLGVAVQPAGAVTLRGAAYTGWRLPTLNELYRPFRVGADATAANAALAPERVRGVDAGVDYRPATTVQLSATLFANRLENAISNVTLGRGPGLFPGVGFVGPEGSYRQRRNLDAIVARGIEVEGTAALRALRFSASYAFVRARVRDGGALDRLRPAQTPRHQASATLAWEKEGARAALTARYVASQFEDDANSRVLDDAATLDGVLRLPLARGISLEARAENLTDARVEAGVSGADVIERATPRTIWVGFRIG